MSKIRDLRTEEQAEARSKTLSKAGINCFLTEGFSMRFLRELEKFCTYWYLKYGVKGDLDWWLDASRDKVIDRLRTVYDPNQGPLVPFVVSCLRNEASSVSRREGRAVEDETEQEEIIQAQESPIYVQDELHLHAFTVRAARLGLHVEASSIHLNVQEEILTSMSKVYAWLRLKGEV